MLIQQPISSNILLFYYCFISFSVGIFHSYALFYIDNIDYQFIQDPYPLFSDQLMPNSSIFKRIRCQVLHRTLLEIFIGSIIENFLFFLGFGLRFINLWYLTFSNCSDHLVCDHCFTFLDDFYKCCI